MGETALIVAVPEAEPLVGRFREKYDSSAALGVPAHVTLVYPFLDPDAIGPDDLAALTSLFAAAQQADIAFARCGRFEPRILWLAPEPAEALLEPMRRLFRRWPQCPPYAGTIVPDAVVPHLTVADSISGEALDRIEMAVAGGLPLWSRLTEAWLIENRTGRWERRRRFAIG